ncbi:MAG: 1-acyl-sn-glycerol-3-phosphate acyltransferase, partial [Rhodospirillales bacterium]|nr:1-acyl-sn-glycerol-3-phosphate acyltransferase [Rhodospirillales bacterium]
MTVVRSILFNAFFFGWLGICLLFMFFMLPLPRIAMHTAVRWWSISAMWGMKWIAGISYRVKGLEKIPAGAVIFSAKHQSAWDTLIYHVLFKNLMYVLKIELLKIPLWGWYARKCQAIAVDRSGGAAALKKMVRDSKRLLGLGRHLAIFPEGTRTAPGQRTPYHPGVAALYRQTGATVVPVAVNSGLFWGRRSFRKEPGVITIEFLDPIEPGLDRRTFMALLESRVEEATDRLVEEASKEFGIPYQKATAAAEIPPESP